LEEHAASIFRVKEKAEQEAGKNQSSAFHLLLLASWFAPLKQWLSFTRAHLNIKLRKFNTEITELGSSRLTIN
jgi:hypothetical protein